MFFFLLLLLNLCFSVRVVFNFLSCYILDAKNVFILFYFVSNFWLYGRGKEDLSEEDSCFVSCGSA